jgi:hypothetical protein
MLDSEFFQIFLASRVPVCCADAGPREAAKQLVTRRDKSPGELGTISAGILLGFCLG